MQLLGGWDLVTLAEHYGMPYDQTVVDTDWIKEAAAHGWPVLMKDKQIRHRSAEIAAVVSHRARCFVIPRGDLGSADMTSRFITNKRAIFTAAALPGPYICSVQADRISALQFPKEHNARLTTWPGLSGTVAGPGTARQGAGAVRLGRVRSRTEISSRTMLMPIMIQAMRWTPLSVTLARKTMPVMAEEAIEPA